MDSPIGAWQRCLALAAALLLHGLAWVAFSGWWTAPPRPVTGLDEAPPAADIRVLSAADVPPHSLPRQPSPATSPPPAVPVGDAVPLMAPPETDPGGADETGGTADTAEDAPSDDAKPDPPLVTDPEPERTSERDPERQSTDGGIGAESDSGLEDAREVAEATWEAALRRHLMAFRDYPRQARLRGLEGTVTLQLAVDATGTIEDFQLLESSGHGLLDEAVRRMAHQASPVPAPPASAMTGSRATVTVPVRFSLTP
ncbi:TonB family protein [Spiribacter sp. 2438]|uniref:energy transducer TonB n=1 Tax=Spiribacter sp. 2438 TaxID=2666185 RepID=UPI0012AF2B42|nr:energy transducer TonB [Spiribacter sp. 2438]QGM21935.1 TonB family protein [Spiribacter sp. 2438]